MLLIFTAYASIYIPHLFVGSIWLAQRTIVAVFSFIAILFIIALYLVKNKKTANFVFAAALIFLTLNVVKIKDIGLNHFQVNALDREYAVEIQKNIEMYEADTGITVNNIATANDINPTYNYWGIKYCKFDTNVRAYVVDWGPVNIIKHYSGRNYNSVEMNQDIYNQYFNEKDWNGFNFEEQAVFDGDTLYLILY